MLWKPNELGDTGRGREVLPVAMAEPEGVRWGSHAELGETAGKASGSDHCKVGLWLAGTAHQPPRDTPSSLSWLSGKWPWEQESFSKRNIICIPRL